MPIVHFEANLLNLTTFGQSLSLPIEVKPLGDVEELCHAPLAFVVFFVFDLILRIFSWLWHYLRRSKQVIFFKNNY